MNQMAAVWNPVEHPGEKQSPFYYYQNTDNQYMQATAMEASRISS